MKLLIFPPSPASRHFLFGILFSITLIICICEELIEISSKECNLYFVVDMRFLKLEKHAEV
jgi:hypothetical protein